MIPFCSPRGRGSDGSEFFAFFPPVDLEKQILSRRASWLGVAQWPHRHLGLRVCQSFTVCWLWSKSSSLFGVLCLKRLWPCRQFVQHWNLRPLSFLCFLSKMGFRGSFCLQVRPASPEIVLLQQRHSCSNAHTRTNSAALCLKHISNQNPLFICIPKLCKARADRPWRSFLVLSVRRASCSFSQRSTYRSGDLKLPGLQNILWQT